VGVVFEQLRGRLMRFSSYHREGSQLIAYVLDTLRRDPLGLAERSTHAGNRALVVFDPRLPCSNALDLPDPKPSGSEAAIEAARMRTLSIALGSGKLAQRVENILRLHALAEIGIDKSSLNDAIAPY
jgi:hypothetical protein